MQHDKLVIFCDSDHGIEPKPARWRIHGFFFSGLCAAVIATLLCYVTLDVDVVRQKAERSAARVRIVKAEFPQSFVPEMAAMLERTIATEKRFWGIGVSLAWLAAALVVLSLLPFIAGGIEAGYVLG
jgi:hypothetical protein